jgi:deoxyribonuclease V
MVTPVRERFVPDPALSREEMEALQREVAAAAVFADDGAPDPAAVAVDAPLSPEPTGGLGGGDAPVVAGIDQAFRDEEAVSAVVAVRDGHVVERVGGVAPLEIPYIPGLLSFREGGPILAALAELSVDPDLLVFDGSGRIHFREAGLATHLGVTLDLPSVGVAKNLLCGEPRRSVEGLAAGERVPVEAGADCTAPAGTVIGHAYQSRQFDSSTRHVNPLYVSPGHRVSADSTTDLVAALCAGYKLPEPTRLADKYADRLKEGGG